jgi:2-enoate reductase
LREEGIWATGRKHLTPCAFVYRDDVKGGTLACVIGGGSVGCETALYLAQHGWSVTLLEMLDAVATDLFEANRVMLLELLKQHGVSVLTGRAVRKVTSTTVVTSALHGEEMFSADLVVLATGRRPVNGLAKAAQKLVKETYTIGDCVTPRKIKDAMWEAFKLAITA